MQMHALGIPKLTSFNVLRHISSDALLDSSLVGTGPSYRPVASTSRVEDFFQRMPFLSIMPYGLFLAGSELSQACAAPGRQPARVRRACPGGSKKESQPNTSLAATIHELAECPGHYKVMFGWKSPRVTNPTCVQAICVQSTVSCTPTVGAVEVRHATRSPRRCVRAHSAERRCCVCSRSTLLAPSTSRSVSRHWVGD